MKSRINILSIILISFLLVEETVAQTENTNTVELTGSLYADSKIIMDNYSELSSNPMADDITSKKSPVLAGVLSDE